MPAGKSGLAGAEEADIDVLGKMAAGGRRATRGGEEPLADHHTMLMATPQGRSLACTKEHSINHIHHADGIDTMCIGHEFTKSKAGSEYFTRTRTKTKN